MKRTVILTVLFAALLLTLGGCRRFRHYDRVWARPALDTLVNDSNRLEPDGGARRMSIDDDLEGAKSIDEIFDEPVMDLPDPPEENEMRRRNSQEDRDELDYYFGRN